MANESLSGMPAINKAHIVGVYLLTVLLPFTAICIEAIGYSGRISTSVIEKWFLFFAIGIRFLLGGIKQVARIKGHTGELFHIDGKQCCPVVRELGFANLSVGVVALVSFFIPAWRIVSLFGSGLYFGAATFSCFAKRSSATSETFALVSNFSIFVILVILLLTIQ